MPVVGVEGGEIASLGGADIDGFEFDHWVVV